MNINRHCNNMGLIPPPPSSLWTIFSLRGAPRGSRPFTFKQEWLLASCMTLGNFTKETFHECLLCVRHTTRIICAIYHQGNTLMHFALLDSHLLLGAQFFRVWNERLDWAMSRPLVSSQGCSRTRTEFKRRQLRTFCKEPMTNGWEWSLRPFAMKIQ